MGGPNPKVENFSLLFFNHSLIRTLKPFIILVVVDSCTAWTKTFSACSCCIRWSRYKLRSTSFHIKVDPEKRKLFLFQFPSIMCNKNPSMKRAISFVEFFGTPNTVGSIRNVTIYGSIIEGRVILKLLLGKQHPNSHFQCSFLVLVGPLDTGSRLLSVVIIWCWFLTKFSVFQIVAFFNPIVVLKKYLGLTCRRENVLSPQNPWIDSLDWVCLKTFVHHAGSSRGH